jgi:tetratricopeptide (TPR) repeat protein
MRVRRLGFVVAILACVALASPSGMVRLLTPEVPIASQPPELGTIQFPTSGAPTAQPAFIEGVKDLHSFEFDEAAAAFKNAQQADPNFALACWGEAMSYNHPLWAQVDVEAARKALGRLALTLEGRLAKAKMPKEKAYLEAVDQLFSAEGDKLARDQAYSQAMARMYQQWPDDHEVATFYALSLLGTVRPGDKGFRRQALAASIVERVFKENPNHPGAAHFIIHAFDDPDHAPLGLTAARAYSKIAPSAPHALHMPSHIFVQLGMWDDVAASNTVAYKAAIDLLTRMHLAEGREDFHTLSWLEYANLMRGKFDEAKMNIELARQASNRNQGNGTIRDGYLGMRARYILETAQWEKIPLANTNANANANADAVKGGKRGEEHAAMPGMAAMGARYNGSRTWTFIAGMSAAKLGDFAAAEKAAAELRAIRERTEAGGNVYGAKPFAIMEREVVAVTRLARGQIDEAVRLAKDAVDIELTMSAPSGPPEPIKPALELYGDVLLEAGRPKDAAAAYDQQLLRTPNRTPSVKGLARAKEKVATAKTSAAR